MLLLHQGRSKEKTLEQAVGIEPDDSGVAHRCVTATLRLHSGAPLRRLLGVGPCWHPKARLTITSVSASTRERRNTSWVGQESNLRWTA